MGNLNLKFYRQIVRNADLTEEEMKEHEEMVRQYDDEQYRRESTATWRNCGASEFMQNRSGFDLFVEVNKGQAIIKEKAEMYTDRILNGSNENMILVGDAGTGKTFYALSSLKKFCLTEKPKIMQIVEYAAMVKRVVDGKEKMVPCYFGDKDYELTTRTEWCGVRQFHKGLFTKSTDFIDAVMQKNNRESWKSYKEAELLVIDEIGRSNNRNEQPLLFKLLDARIDNELPTIITSNLDHDALKEYLGDATMSRLMGNAIVLDLSTLPDMRQHKRGTRNGR